MRDMAIPSPFRRTLMLLVSNKHLAIEPRFALQGYEFMGVGLDCFYLSGKTQFTIYSSIL